MTIQITIDDTPYGTGADLTTAIADAFDNMDPTRRYAVTDTHSGQWGTGDGRLHGHGQQDMSKYLIAEQDGKRIAVIEYREIGPDDREL